jgi:D-glycero-D-manno-heptose 1,7-bisphosphate phosphatase
VITNQAGIARGLYTEEDFHALTAWIDDDLAVLGAHIDATYYCPHHPTEGKSEYRRQCGCRKPAPGLILRALDEWRFDPGRSLMIGDTAHDMMAASAAGVRAVRFTGGNLFECVRQALP